MNYDFHTAGYINSWEVAGVNIIKPWGIEFGDSHSFFSLNQPDWRNRKLKPRVTISANKLSAEMDIQMSEGRYHLEYHEEVHKRSITRQAELEALTPGLLMDFVIRYRFRKDLFRHAVIADKTVPHRNSNRYHQYPVTKVTLIGDTACVTVSLTATNHPPNFTPYMYVRDYRDEWIIHCRLLPITYAKKVVKLNTSWFNRALPTAFSKILLALPYFEAMTWYRSERSPYPRWHLLGKVFKPNAYGLGSLEPHQKLKLVSSVAVKES